MSPRLGLLRSQSDERLVVLARAGNERAFTAIVERYGAELHALARRLCADGRSEDIVQQAFLSAFAALSAGSEVRHLRGWLYQIVRNAATRPAGPLCVPLDRVSVIGNSLEDVVQQRALAMTTLSELARLPTRQRQAMIGTALDGRPRAEVASSMGLSEGAVRQLVHRARTTLRSAVTAVTPWPLARWIAAARPDVPGTAELAAGAGAASSGGLAIKLGALLASGTLLTGAAIDLHALPAHRDGTHAAISAHARPNATGAHRAAITSLARSGYVDLVSIRSPAAVGNAGQGRYVAQAGGGARPAFAHRRHHDTAPGRSGGRDGGQTAGRQGGGDTRGGAGASSGGRDGSGGSSRGNSGSDGHGGAGGQSGGDRGGTSNNLDSGSRTGTGSGGGGDAQMASDSHSFGSTINGSGSSQSSGSGGQSGSSDGSVASSGTAVGTTVGSGSGGSQSGPSGSGSGADGGSGSGAGSGGSGD